MAVMTAAAGSDPGATRAQTTSRTWRRRRAASSSGSSFKDKLYFGGTVTLSFSGDTNQIGFFPMVGYKITPKLSGGVEVGYEYVSYDEPIDESTSNYGAGVFGRYRLTPKIYGHVEYEAINYEIQGSAADLMKRAMLAVRRRLAAQKLHARMLLTVHDELVFEAPPEEVAPLAKLAREEMTGAMKLDVPLKVDVAAGPNWLDVEDVAG